VTAPVSAHQKQSAAVEVKGKVDTGWTIGHGTSLAVLIAVLMSTSTMAAEVWRAYSNSAIGYRIEIPNTFAPSPDKSSAHLLFSEISGNAQIDVYGGRNVKSLSASQLAEELTQADQVADVTYRAGGRSWIVLSGHYQRDGGGEEIIYYTKLMLSSDRSRVAGFEISYPASEKHRMDRVVARMERTFHGP
jgi:hypothetical protein